MTESPAVRVLVADEFKQLVRDLKKRYRQIQADIQPLIEQLRNGEFPGNQIAGVGYTVYKVRAKNSDIRKDKSGGYRIIDQILSPSVVLLLYIYPKSDQSDVEADDIRTIIEKFQANSDSPEN
jgi:mRNA-degrading endonuclease RelE of RelBE toxin-antitoxin system